MMKKTFAVLMVLVMLLLAGCNYRLVDTKWNFRFAYITLPDGKVKEVEVRSWTEDNTSVTIQAKDGNTYCVSMHNCILAENRIY